MKILLKIVLDIAARVDGNDFVCKFERNILITPACLVRQLNYFFDKTTAEIQLKLWQISHLDGYSNSARVSIYVKDLPAYETTIGVPQKIITLSDMKDADRRMSKELDKIMLDGRNRALLYIGCSPEFQNQ